MGTEYPRIAPSPRPQASNLGRGWTEVLSVAAIMFGRVAPILVSLAHGTD
jgi:hypothetical protein